MAKNGEYAQKRALIGAKIADTVAAKELDPAKRDDIRRRRYRTVRSWLDGTHPAL